MNVETKWLGLVEYERALNYQKELRTQVADGDEAYILGLEHPQVITLGIRGDKQRDIASTTELPVVHVDRGGKATLHNPGQLIIYPIIPYKKWGLRPVDLINLLLDATKLFLEECNIIIVTKKNGLFGNSGKLVSIGMNIKGGISSHGLAINVGNCLSDFQLVHACGVKGAAVDKVNNHGLCLTPEQAFKMWLKHIYRELSRRKIYTQIKEFREFRR